MSFAIQAMQQGGPSSVGQIEQRINQLEGVLRSFEGPSPLPSLQNQPIAPFNTQFSPAQAVQGAVNGTSAPAFESIIQENAIKHRVPPALIQAVIQQESAFNPNAISKAGAQGLMQLMPGTAKTLGVQNAFDPAQNIAGGTKYLSQLLGQFNGNIPLALAAYNAGPGAVNKYHAVPPYAETQQYVKKVLSNYLANKAKTTPAPTLALDAPPGIQPRS
ncbi:MAG: lytic transglycosylase domain-containing protein [Vampirovibrionales bacterium]|nr:lytic transglycosylase domain-containing protein [Vampirovibrionales bacterium]